MPAVTQPFTTSGISLTFPLPANEAERVAALAQYGVLETIPEQVYDDLARMAAFICGVPIALVSLVDSNRQWFKARVGLAVAETPREHSFCAHAIVTPAEIFTVEDATTDPRFAANPLVTADPHIRFYAGAPLVTPTGHALGTICVIDRIPRRLTVEQHDLLTTLSRIIVAQLELRAALRGAESQLLAQEAFTQQLLDYQQNMEAAMTKVESLSRTDGLTAVYNRRAFNRQLDDEFSRARRHGLPLSLLMLDIDRFKDYNDSFGHQAGDDVLITVAALLRESRRANDFVARYGGEEFAVILPGTGKGTGKDEG